MKIKVVSEITGLSDRAIRYYFEQHLIFPKYSENYLGRKTFAFSKSDIDDLKNIAVLRQFDFTIDEIRAIINDENTSTTIISNVKHRTEKVVLDGKEKLSVLSKLSNDKTYMVGQLEEELSKLTFALPEHKEIIKTNTAKVLLSAIKTIWVFIIVWMPVLLSVFGVAFSINNYRYPVFAPMMILLTLVSLWPSIGAQIVSKTKWKRKNIFKRICLILCFLSIPVSYLMSSVIITKSETTDFRNYRDFDADCLANRNMVFQELFPAWPNYFENVEQADGSSGT